MPNSQPRRTIPHTSLQVFPLNLGGNVFGWTADEKQSFAVLDAYAAGGGNFIDTADVYSAWIPGNRGGESETILGRWLKARGKRDEIVIATKVGKAPGLSDLKAETIRTACERSLSRLQTDHIDLYYAHADDPSTPLEETLGAFDALVREGKVRAIAASNFSAARLAESLATSDRLGLARFVAVQPHYSLVHRAEYEAELLPLCQREGLVCLPYYALAKGFLTGKYRPGAKVESARAQGAEAYLTPEGIRLLGVLDELAAAHDTSVSAIALAWLAAQPTVLAPIASARTPEQVPALLASARVTLSAEELARLSAFRL